MRKAVSAVVALAVIVAAAYAYRQHQTTGSWPLQEVWAARTPAAPAGAEQEFAIPVEAAKVAVETISRQIETIGTLRSNESVMIRPEIAGRISHISFDEGQPVRRGQLLVKLDDSTVLAQVEQARANLALSRANSERAQKLYRQGAGTERARDEAGARLQVDQAAVDLVQATLGKTEIIAPFDGIAGLRRVSVGAYVTPGQDIANIEDIDPLKVDFRVPEVHLDALRVGQSLDITADAFAGRAFTATVYAIDPLIDENGRAVALRARLPNPDRMLRPGLFVRVRLIVERIEDALLVPEEALVPQGDKVAVMRVVDGTATPTEVRTGIRRAGSVQVLEGLSAEDTVITAGHMKVRPGAKVSVVGKPGEGA